jgi:hypothetical protein
VKSNIAATAAACHREYLYVVPVLRAMNRPLMCPVPLVAHACKRDENDLRQGN